MHHPCTKILDLCQHLNQFRTPKEVLYLSTCSTFLYKVRFSESNSRVSNYPVSGFSNYQIGINVENFYYEDNYIHIKFQHNYVRETSTVRSTQASRGENFPEFINKLSTIS